MITKKNQKTKQLKRCLVQDVFESPIFPSPDSAAVPSKNFWLRKHWMMDGLHLKTG